MGQRKIAFTENEYYHIYNRGVNKMEIFKSHGDYERFLKLLYITNNTKRVKFTDISPSKAWTFEKEGTLADIGAYCLMPNHFHILIRAKNERGVPEFLQRLGTAYSKYFNLKYGRSGTLFEDKFKAEHVNNDQHLQYLFSYIHLNPVKLIQSDWKESSIDTLKAKNFLDTYKHSSYSEYLGEKRPESVILETSVFPEYFTEDRSFQKFIDLFLVSKQGLDLVV